MNIVIDFFKTTFLNEFQTTMSGDRIASGLLVSFFLSLFVILIYRVTYHGVALNQSFCFSLILLSMVTSMVIMTITTNLALSLGMVGALSIVRFRTAIKDPNDTVFMFWSIAVGIMAGAGLIYIPIITNLSLGVLYLAYYFIKRNSKSSPYLLIVRYQNDAADCVLEALGSLKKSKVKSKTVSAGTTELCLEIKLTPQSMNLIDSVSKIDGVLDASAVSYQGETDLV